jgi:cell division protein FtsB
MKESKQKEKTNFITRVATSIVKYKYIFVFSFFGIWVTFIDSYNLIDRFEKMQKLNALQKEIAYYKAEIYTYRQQYKELFSDKEDLEKFAREQYQMKEENEDLFIIISE